MGDPKRFQVTVSFACGARATVMMTSEPVVPSAIWTDGSLSWVGDADGPMLELVGNDVTSISVRRIDEGARPAPSGPGRDRYVGPGRGASPLIRAR